MAKIWNLPVHDADQIARLSRELVVPAVLAQLLLNRGITDPVTARNFLAPSLKGLHDPSLLPNATEAAQRIVGAMRGGRRITIYGDYDVDGVCGSAILLECLRLAGADVKFYVPNRLEEGYGLNSAALECICRDQKAELVVTVDCGIASCAEAQVARQLGLELIVTDHHEFGQKLPEADCLVHPRLPSSKYPFGGVSGAGVALKLAWEVARQLEGTVQVSPPFRDFLLRSVTLAALGAVADVVPLCDENRILVRHGLVSLKQKPPLGLRELMATAGLTETEKLGAEHVAFQLAPRINAAGRLGQARLAVELLTTRNPERARELARYLDGQNEQRQVVERRILREAKELAELEHDLEHDRALVLAKADWHAGVIGIVAARMAERYWRPVILISLSSQLGQGSGRSIPGFDLYRALDGCRDWLVAYGGHTMAAGLKIRAEEVPQFRKAFCQYAAGNLAEQDMIEQIEIDAEVPLGDVTPRLIASLENLAPFGCGNRRPLLMAARVELIGPPKRIGGGERHLSFRVRQSGAALRAVAFAMGDRAEELARGKWYDMAFSPQLNTFRGFTSVDLHVKDFRACENP